MTIEMIIWLSLAGLMMFGFGMVILIIAGKDIIFAFYRKIVFKGCDVYVINSNKQTSYYYKVPKDGKFIIKGHTYVTNPNKLLSLDEETKQDVKNSVEKRLLQLNAKLELLKRKKEEAEDKLKKMINEEGKPINEVLLPEINKIQGIIGEINKSIKLTSDLITNKEEVFYNRRRPMFLYIEGDPVPKNLFDFYTTLDCTLLDNMVARAITNVPKIMKDYELFFKYIKLALMVGGGAIALMIFLQFKMESEIQQLAKAMAVKLVV